VAPGGVTPAIARIPLVVLTGALGSGKTTLLRAALDAAENGETAVIVNEFGAVGIDQHLLAQGSETLALLENGCICCAMRDDLAELLQRLFWRRLERSIPRFRRVVIETTGLADPRNLRDMIGRDGLVAERYAAPHVVTVVDAEAGIAGLERPEAEAQLLAADTVVISKTDLVMGRALRALEGVLVGRNPRAGIRHSGRADPAFDVLWRDVETTQTRPAAMPDPVPPSRFRAEHVAEVRSHAIRIAPADPVLVHHALRHVLSKFGDGCFRVKGLVREPGAGTTWLIQAVGARVQPPERLETVADGAADDLVFITRGVDAKALREALSACGLDLGPATRVD
jgi:G3E family GTPase